MIPISFSLPPPPKPPNPPNVEPPVDSGSGRWPFGLGGTGFSLGSLGFASSENIDLNEDSTEDTKRVKLFLIFNKSKKIGPNLVKVKENM